MLEEKVSEQTTVSPDELAAADANPISASDLSDNGVSDSLHKQDMGFTEDELRRNLEAIASTGKFWTEWDKLKSMLSFKLKQVLSEYSEGKMPVEEQHSALGETYLELIQRLDEALLSFDEGPPFTLQRLCEILLTAQSIYPKLRKLALALEKNLLVSSILFTSYADPSLDPATNNRALEADVPKKNGEMEKSSNEENGVDNTVISSTTTTAAAARDDKAMVGMEVEEEAKDHQEEEAKDHEKEEEQEEGVSSMDTEEESPEEEVSTAAAEPFPSPESEMKPSSQPTELKE